MYTLRLFAILLFFLSMSVTSYSQKEKFLDISLGTSIPLGSFASTDGVSGTVQNGYAGTGGFLALTFRKRINTSNFGITAMAAVNMNFFRTDRIVERYKILRPGFVWRDDRSNWLSISLLPGVYYEGRFAKKTSFIAGLHTGPALARHAGYIISGTLNENGYAGEARGELKDTWAFTVSSYAYAGFKISTGDRFDLLLNAGYNYLKPNFKDVKYFYGEWIRQPNGLSQAFNNMSKQTYTQSMHTIWIGAGLGFKI